MILLPQNFRENVMKKSSHTLSIPLSMFLLSSTIAFSAEIPSTKSDSKQLDSVTVIGNTHSSYLNTKEINLNRTMIDIDESAKSIQVFNEDFIEDAQPQNIEDIIKMSSNTSYQGDNHGRTNQISMRGFSSIPILFDGMRITNKMAHPELFNLSSVEILKGPDSLQYGESSPGGLVNLVNKKATKVGLGKIELDVNDNPSYATKLDVGGSLNEAQSLYFRLNSVLEYDEGFTNSNTDSNRVFVAPSLAYDFNDHHTLTLVAEYTKETTPSSFGTYVNSKGELVAPIDHMISHPDEEFEKTQKIVGFDFTSQFESWNSNLRYRYIDYEGVNGDVHMPQRYNEATNTVTRAYAYQKQEFQEHALQYTLNKELDIFDFRNRISVGGDFNKAYTKTTMFYDPMNPYNINLSHPNYENLTSLSDHPNATDMTGDKTYTKSWGMFFQDSINFTDDFLMNVGVRYSESKPKDGQKSDDWTPSLGFVYKVTPQTSLYANYSESFTPNTVSDSSGNVLDPETGEGFELGVKQKLFDDRFMLTAAVFKIEKNNIALSDDSTPLTTDYVASGKQKSKGFEIDMSGEITPNWSIVASYGYTHTKNVDVDNLDLRNIPKHTANLFTSYYLSSFNLPHLYIGGGARYLGARYADDNNEIKFDSEIIYNATLGYKKGNWRASLSMQNLTDEEYVEGALASNAAGTRVYVGTPRTILASISYTF